jgi:N4-gp56 family major capsid protein
MAMPNNNNSLWNDEFYANFVTQAEFAAYEMSVARELTTVFDIPLNNGRIAQVPIWGQGTAQLITDEAAATARNTTSTSALITLAEHVYYSQVTDMLRNSAYNDVMSQLAEVSGRSIGESFDSDAFSKFDGFYSDIGSTTTELTVNLILQAAATLRSRKVMGPYYAVVHPAQAYNLKKQLTTTLPYSGASGNTQLGAISDVGNQALFSGFVGSIAGCTIYESAMVTAVTTGGATAYRGGVFAKTGLGIAQRGGLNLQTLYLPQQRATDMVVTAVAGASVLQSTHGVAITADGIIN